MRQGTRLTGPAFSWVVGYQSSWWIAFSLMFVKVMKTNERGHWLTECLKQLYLLRSLVKTSPFPSVCLIVMTSISASWNILVAPMGCAPAVGMHLPPCFLLLFFIFLLYYSSDLCVWKHQVQFPTETCSGNFIFPSSFILSTLFLLLVLFITRSSRSSSSMANTYWIFSLCQALC